MKLSRLFFDTKTVDYYGVALNVPGDVSYLATDANGWVWGYIIEPYRIDSRWQNADSGLSMYRIAAVELEGIDWWDTCVTV